MDADGSPKAAALLFILEEKGYNAVEAILELDWTGLEYQSALEAKESSSDYI